MTPLNDKGNARLLESLIFGVMLIMILFDGRLDWIPVVSISRAKSDSMKTGAGYIVIMVKSMEKEAINILQAISSFGFMM